MILDKVKLLLMNNPLRAAIQRHFEAPRFLRIAGHLRGAGNALEIGCGRGVGVEIILDLFKAENVDAFDLNPQMVDLAKRRLSQREGVGDIWVGDVTKISSPDASYDSVFDFGIVHHVSDWRKALSEIHRVLKPGGHFYAEEAFSRFICHPLFRRLLEHPQEDRFDYHQFEWALNHTGLIVLRSNQMWNSLGWFVSERR